MRRRSLSGWCAVRARGGAAVALAAALAALGCSTTSEKQSASAPMMGRSAGIAMSADAEYAPAPDAGEVVDPARMIVRSGSIDVEVEDPAAAARRLSARVEQLGGVVSDSSSAKDGVRLSVRVPSEGLEPFLDEVAGLGEEKSRWLSSQDLTEQYSDLRAEIDNLVALRDRLRMLLDRAKKVEEVLEVERELTRVQTRLDALMRRTQRIEKDVALSNVAIYLAAKPEPRVLGPLGLLYEGLAWVGKKLWVISP